MTKLNRIVLNYTSITPKSCFLTIFEYSKTRETGVYDIIDIPLYFQSLYIKQLSQYYFYETDQYDRLPHLLLMKCSLMLVIVRNKKLSLKIFNLKPYVLEPFLQVMKKYNFGENKITKMTLRQIYYWIVEKLQILISSIVFPISEAWYRIHYNILPNYLKTFHYKLTWNLMLVKLKPHTAVYHHSKLYSCCSF